MTPYIDVTDDARLVDFVRESNLIEGIDRLPTLGEVAALERFLRYGSMSVEKLVELVHEFTVGQGELRDKFGRNVSVGRHLPPPGGPRVVMALNDLIGEIVLQECDPYHAHVKYELLHPFTDGNGRSGRALWAWHMNASGTGDPFALPFLHRFYYQTLDAARD